MRGEWGSGWHVWEVCGGAECQAGTRLILRVSTGRCQDRGLCAVGRKAGRKVGVRGVLVRVLEGSPVRTVVSASCLGSTPCLLENPADGP